ncbi:hypothetical protein Tco_1117017 [Tanacetum coccineum]
MVYVVNGVLASSLDMVLEKNFAGFALQEMEIHPLMLLIRTLSMILQTIRIFKKRNKKKAKINKAKHGKERAKSSRRDQTANSPKKSSFPPQNPVTTVSSMAKIDSKEAQMKSKAGICFGFTSHNKHTSFLLSKEAQAASPRLRL